jgi:ABC-type multidrug transport system permease subunit
MNSPQHHNPLRASLRRSLAQTYHALLQAREGFRLFDVTVWPLVLFLSMTLFAGVFTKDVKVIGLIVLGALGWRVLYHFELETVQVYMESYWAGTVEHMMVSPVRWWELVLGGVVTALIKIAIIGSLFLVLGWLMFGFVIGNWGAVLLAMLAVALCGVILAIFSLGVAFVKRGDSFAFIFAFPDAIAVLSGVFYPTNIFPEPFRTIALLLPSTQAFNMLKATIGMGTPNFVLFFLTAAFWLVAAVLFNHWALRRARRDGKLVKMK